MYDIDIQIASLGWTFSSQDRMIIDELNRGWQGFVGCDEHLAAKAGSIELVMGDVPGTYRGRDTPLHIQWEGKTLKAHLEGKYEGYFDMFSRTGRFVLGRRCDVPVSLGGFASVVSNVPRLLLPVIAPLHDMFLLHSSSVVFDGRAYVFAGVSGAGKSTLARLFIEQAMTEDITVLDVRPLTGYPGTCTAWSTFLDYMPGLERKREGYPIARINFLDRQAPRGISVLPTKNSVAKLVVNALDIQCMHSEQLLTIADDLVASVGNGAILSFDIQSASALDGRQQLKDLITKERLWENSGNA